MSNKSSRREFMTRAALLAAIGATSVSAAEQTEEISLASIEHAETIAGISFTPKERAQILSTISEQQAIFAARLAQGTIPDGIAPATVFNPMLPDTSLNTVTPLDESNTLPDAGPCPTDDHSLAFAPVWKLSQWLRNRSVTSERLTRLALKRLKRFNDELYCVVTFMDQAAIGQARAADKELDQGDWRGPLHGVPWGAKDIIDTAGTKTTWGASTYKDRVPLRDASVVQKLNEAGAVLVAKLAVGALAYGDIWFGGKCRNPFNPEQGSSGSSAGSASATAAGLVPFTLGTETYGSIVSPCMRCGATGLRPTFGRVSRTGTMALCWSLDKIGPICRTVLDTTLVLNVINGSDGGDPSSVDVPFAVNPNSDIKGIRIGVDRSLLEGPTKESDLAAIEAAEKAGAIIVETQLPAIEPAPLLIPLFVESAAAFEELTRSNQDDLLQWQDDEAWPNTFRQSWLIPAVEHVQASRYRREVMKRMHDWMNDSFDVFLSPAFCDLLLITNNTGHPSLVMRTTMKNNLPSGSTLVGRLFDESTICRVGMAIESQLHVHNTPPSLTSA